MLLAIPCLASAASPGVGWYGYLALSGRYFPEPPLNEIQQHDSVSISGQMEGRWRWRGADFSFTPYLRLDSGDNKRTHLDIRELDARFSAAEWDWQIGIGKVFWGVVESRHLVDIVNQTDQVEDIYAEQKLGQPMIHASRFTDWGLFELFMLPGFRERTYPGKEGRLYLPIDVENPVYESSQKHRHVDWATRWSRTFGSWDLGLSGFYGIRRDPRLVPDYSTGLAVPYYDLIHQISLDLQGSEGDWVWKLESFYRDTPADDYVALVAGFEYTRYGLFESSADLGLLAEYLHDGRENTLETSFQNDLFLALRLNLNDAQDSEILAGMVIDLDQESLIWRLEASRRLAEQWRLNLNIQAFAHTVSGEPIDYWRKDSHLQLELVHYF